MGIGFLRKQQCQPGSARIPGGFVGGASAPASVGAGTAGQVCAGFNAMTFEGDSGADAISAVANAYHLTQAQAAAIDERCPELRRIVPAGA